MPFSIRAFLVVELIRRFNDGARTEPVIQPDSKPALINTRLSLVLVQNVVTHDRFEVLDETGLHSRRAVGQLHITAVAIVFESEGTAQSATRVVGKIIHAR